MVLTQKFGVVVADDEAGESQEAGQRGEGQSDHGTRLAWWATCWWRGLLGGRGVCRLLARSRFPTREFGVGGEVAGALDGQEGVGEHRAGDAAVPGDPLADLVLVQAGELFGLLVVLFDLPADPGLLYRGAGRGGGGGVDEEVGVFEVEAPAGQFPLVLGAAYRQLVFESLGGFLVLDPDGDTVQS
ncbi:hypothetical protein [Kitasatospora azatica]|uniref:hypothetical protein n=1 Tax=Kitasatospora azatica TaxID=58347 RepID=UPI0012FADA3B|nr:hypothetical protein [Kitasatospora azatica]